MTDNELKILAESECAKADPDWHLLFSGEQYSRIVTWIDGYNYAIKQSLTEPSQGHH